MNTRKILIVSSDKDLTGIVKISALTLTKLNCQVSIEETAEADLAVGKSKEVNLDLIIIDNDLEKDNTVNIITQIRKDINSKSKKIICLCSGQINKDEIFKAGCDSIMTKEEFKRVVNNVLVF